MREYELILEAATVVEEAMAANPPDESPPAKAEKLSSNQPSISRSTVKKKSARSKPSRKKKKAPDSKIDAMIRILRSNLIGEVKGPVSEPTVRSNKLDAVKSTLRLLDEPGIVAGAFEADDPFELSLETIKSALKTLFNRLKPLVGEARKITKIEGPPARPSKWITPSRQLRKWIPIASKVTTPPGEAGIATTSLAQYSLEKLVSWRCDVSLTSNG
ncbi:hypothetical protein GQ600_17756 [Phytophthora cactorum]|nr:hypothetical protein GQ600_17756 [Phytophthora cactorum]